MDYKSYDEYNFKKRQEVLDAKKKDDEQRARMKEEGMRSLQHLWNILNGGAPSRDYLNGPESLPGMLYENPQGYIRNEILDQFLSPKNIVNDSSPPEARTMPGTYDNMPTGPRPGWDRLHDLLDEPQPVPMPRPNPAIAGMLRVGGSPSADMPAGGMNPLLLEIMLAERRKQEGYPMPPAIPQQLTPPDSTIETWLKGLIPGVNGQPVPNPNPPRHPRGNTIRG